MDPEGKIHSNETDKAAAMAAHFFPKPTLAETHDIENAIYSEELSDLAKLPENKTPGPDCIPNILLKHCKKSLNKILTYMFNACLEQGYLSKYGKRST